MSIYINYVVNSRENLSRIRNPGSTDDGVSPERVVFTNPNNIYYGTFAGELSYASAILSNCTIEGATIHNSYLDDVTLKDAHGHIVDIGELVSEVSSAQQAIEQQQLSSITFLSNDYAMSSNINAMSSSINSLSGGIDKCYTAEEVDELLYKKQDAVVSIPVHSIGNMVTATRQTYYGFNLSTTSSPLSGLDLCFPVLSSS